MKFARLAVLPAFFLFLTSCLEHKPGPLDYGPESTFEEVDQALREPLASSDPALIKLGEFVHTAETQVINEHFGTVMSDTGLTVIERNETATEITLKLLENKITYGADGEQRKQTTERNAVIEKSTVSAFDAFNERAEEALRPMSLTTKATAPEVRRTFHNLVKRVRTIPPPPPVVEQENCGGVAGCMIRVYDISFDVIEWKSETETRKVSYEFSLSPDAPFFAQELNQCMTFLQAIDESKPDTSTRVKVKYCIPVVNFRFEAPST